MKVKFTFDCSLSDFLRRPRLNEVFGLIVDTAVDAAKEVLGFDDDDLKPRARYYEDKYNITEFFDITPITKYFQGLRLSFSGSEIVIRIEGPRRWTRFIPGIKDKLHLTEDEFQQLSENNTISAFKENLKSLLSVLKEVHNKISLPEEPTRADIELRYDFCSAQVKEIQTKLKERELFFWISQTESSPGISLRRMGTEERRPVRLSEVRLYGRLEAKRPNGSEEPDLFEKMKAVASLSSFNALSRKLKSRPRVFLYDTQWGALSGRPTPDLLNDPDLFSRLHSQLSSLAGEIFDSFPKDVVIVTGNGSEMTIPLKLGVDLDRKFVGIIDGDEVTGKIRRIEKLSPFFIKLENAVIFNQDKVPREFIEKYKKDPTKDIEILALEYVVKKTNLQGRVSR